MANTIVCAAFLLIASIFDFKTRKIPNILNGLGFIVAIVLNLQHLNLYLPSFVYAFIVGFILFALGIMGAGDGKMIAVSGFMITADALLESLLLAFLFFGIFSAFNAISKKGFKNFITHEKNSFFMFLNGLKPEGDRCAFAPFFFAGFAAYLILGVIKIC
jgi:prepilin peptidase CpaA